MYKGQKVLLTHAWCRISYSVLRGLTSQGIKVVVADTGKLGMCQASRLPYAKEVYRSLYSDPIGFIDDVDALCTYHDIGLIIPGHEEGELLAKAKESGRFASGATLALVDSKTLGMANDKDHMSRLAKELGVSVAPIVDYHTSDEVKDITDPKKWYVARARYGNSSKGVRFSRGGESLGNEVKKMMVDFHLESDRLPIIQEFVEGCGWGVSCLYWHGQRIGCFTHRRLQEKIATGGPSTLRMAASNPALEADAHRLLSALNWHGLAMVEFKQDDKRRDHYFVEINPRLWGSIDLSLSSGVNFPWLLYLSELYGSDVALSAFQGAREGIVERWIWGGVLRRLDLMRRGRLVDALSLRDGFHADSFDDFKLDDPFVFLGEVFYYFNKLYKTRSINPIEVGMVR
ncbi:carboxylate--amine ligase [Halomonas sp. LBP4]|uniref:carboxylate--amine ligase n=1 Tax=Halomonas sp. LBP4 TaxID=2044917 RepID=UPI0015E8CE82|nr:ATP-grasp domain-containing protein [Halomonas sp. LBP4]